MEWIDITRWVAVALYTAITVYYCIQLKKEKKDNPHSNIGIRLLTIQIWIILIFIILAMKKISIALVV